MSPSGHPTVIPTSSILFSSQSTDFSRTLSSLKRASLSIKNRLRSIIADSEFVAQVSQAYGLPLVANERCGSWYIAPNSKAGSGYFKSTDGHTHQWSFSLRRLNTALFDVLEQYGGCVIVDSTRRGKAMPDALMKTVPIWCAVFNRFLFPQHLCSNDATDGEQEAGTLFTPPSCVSASEHAQIEARIDGFVRDLETLKMDVAALRRKVRKPLRPIWVTRDSGLPDDIPVFEDFYPILLCTASRRVIGGEVSEGGYIQGAGDDAESWSCGLTPPVFWKNKDQLMNAAEEDMPDLIVDLLEREDRAKEKSAPFVIKPSFWLAVGTLSHLESDSMGDFDAIITIGQLSTIIDTAMLARKHLHLECRSKKLGSRDLRLKLQLIQPYLATLGPKSPKLLICDSNGIDLSIGVALAILCLYSNSEGQFEICNKNKPNKTLIKQRLSWIMTSHPSASPSRATLQSINDFLLTEHEPTTPPLVRPQPNSEQLKDYKNSTLFKSLEGGWAIHRTITNYHKMGLAGSISGTANFIAREPTSSNTALEYLYIEDGIFTTTSPGLQMNISRRWIWRLSSTKDGSDTLPTKGDKVKRPEGVSIHFVKSDGMTEDYLYNDLGCLSIDRDGAEAGAMRYIIEAHAEHPCGEDSYRSKYVFWMHDELLERFEVEHTVKGPEKDYISRTEHRRHIANA